MTTIVLRRSTDSLGSFWEARYEPEDPSASWTALRRYDDHPDTPYRPHEEAYCGRILPAGWGGYTLRVLQEEELPLWDALLDPNKQPAPPGTTGHEKRVSEARSALQSMDWAKADDDTLLLVHAILGS